MFSLFLLSIFFLLGYFSTFTVLYLTKISYYYLWSFIGGAGLLLAAIPLIFIWKRKQFAYDNINTYRTCFHKSYWQSALRELKKLKNLVMISALICLMLLAKLVTLPSGFADLGLSFSYIFLGIGSLLYGPVAGMLMGFLVDNFEFLLFPSGYPYFIGYSISSMLSGLIYGLLFYKTKLSFMKIFTARFLINILINACLGTVWMGIVANYSSIDMYFTRFILVGLPKNLVYLIPQSILLFFMLKALARVFVNINLMRIEVKENIGLF